MDGKDFFSLLFISREKLRLNYTLLGLICQITSYIEKSSLMDAVILPFRAE